MLLSILSLPCSLCPKAWHSANSDEAITIFSLLYTVRSKFCQQAYASIIIYSLRVQCSFLLAASSQAVYSSQSGWASNTNLQSQAVYTITTHPFCFSYVFAKSSLVKLLALFKNVEYRVVLYPFAANAKLIHYLKMMDFFLGFYQHSHNCASCYIQHLVCLLVFYTLLVLSKSHASTHANTLLAAGEPSRNAHHFNLCRGISIQQQ